MNSKKVYVEQISFSRAMIEIKAHIQTLYNLDKKLQQPNIALEEVANSEVSSADVEFLKKYALQDFYKAQNILVKIKKELSEYMHHLDGFLKKNPASQKEFYEQLDILIPLWEEKKKFVCSKIETCNSIIKQSETLSV